MATPASNLAAEILAQLGQDFTVPNVDLTDPEFQIPDETGNPRYDAIPRQELDALTTGVVGGTGAFDVIMSSTKAHLREQYEKGLITGDQYTKAYIELTTASLGTAIQFVLQGDTAYWQALVAQSEARKIEIEAVRAKIELETAKQQLAAATQQAKMVQAQHVLVQMQIASEDAKYQLIEKQQLLVNEQAEAQHAQTEDTRLDDVTPVTGATKAQVDLYRQQIESYKRDTDQKLGKMWLDGWITQKTLDEGLLAPDELTNSGIDAVLAKVRENAGLI